MASSSGLRLFARLPGLHAMCVCVYITLAPAVAVLHERQTSDRCPRCRDEKLATLGLVVVVVSSGDRQTRACLKGKGPPT